MVEAGRSQAELLDHLRASCAEWDGFVQNGLPPIMDAHFNQIEPHIVAAVKGDKPSFSTDYDVVVEESTNRRGLLVADSDHAREIVLARVIAEVVVGKGALPTRMLIFSARPDDKPSVTLDVGVAGICFEPESWRFLNSRGEQVAVNPNESVFVAISAMSWLAWACNLPLVSLGETRMKLALILDRKKTLIRRAQGRMHAAIGGLIEAVRETPAHFGTVSYSKGSAEWAVEFEKPADIRLTATTQALLTQLGIDVGDRRLSDAAVRVGEDADQNPIVGFSDGAGILIISPQENGRRLKIYAQALANPSEIKPNVLAELNTPETIGAALDWTAACQEFVVPTS